MATEDIAHNPADGAAAGGSIYPTGRSSLDCITPAEAAKRIAHRIRTSREDWDQSWWLLPYRTPDNYPAFKVAEAKTALSQIQNGRSCGTTACVGGWAVLEALDAGERLSPNREIGDAAREVLGLSCEEATDLFNPANSKKYVLELLDRISDGPVRGHETADA